MPAQRFDSCPLCEGKDEEVVFDLGAMPPVNSFVEKDKIREQSKYPLKINFCKKCTLVHIDSFVEPEELFSQYLHMSSASRGNARHLSEVAQLMKSKLHLGSDSKVLEIGSNDGTLLKELSQFCGSVLGVDPAKNLSELARSNGVETLTAFFDESVAEDIAKTYGKFDAIVALNVVAHTPTFISMLKGIRSLLKPDGQFLMENAYVVDTILHGQFDTVYHEHVSNFSLHSLTNAYERVGLKAVSTEIIPTQGTSIRVWCSLENSTTAADGTVSKILSRELEKGFVNYENYKIAAQKVVDFKNNLRSLLDKKKSEGKKIVGLGAPARGVVVLNYCELDDSDLNYVIDDTVLKQGKCIPGREIEVSGWDRLNKDKSGTFLLLSWNYEKDMLERLREWAPGSTVIIPFPELREIQL